MLAPKFTNCSDIMFSYRLLTSSTKSVVDGDKCAHVCRKFGNCCLARTFYTTMICRGSWHDAWHVLTWHGSCHGGNVTSRSRTRNHLIVVLVCWKWHVGTARCNNGTWYAPSTPPCYAPGTAPCLQEMSPPDTRIFHTQVSQPDYLRGQL